MIEEHNKEKRWVTIELSEDDAAKADFIVREGYRCAPDVGVEKVVSLALDLFHARISEAVNRKERAKVRQINVVPFSRPSRA